MQYVFIKQRSVAFRIQWPTTTVELLGRWGWRMQPAAVSSLVWSRQRVAARHNQHHNQHCGRAQCRLPWQLYSASQTLTKKAIKTTTLRWWTTQRYTNNCSPVVYCSWLNFKNGWMETCDPFSHLVLLKRCNLGQNWTLSGSWGYRTWPSWRRQPGLR